MERTKNKKNRRRIFSTWAYLQLIPDDLKQGIYQGKDLYLEQTKRDYHCKAISHTKTTDSWTGLQGKDS